MNKVSRSRRQDADDGLIEKVIHVNRVAKVVKGGRRFSFSAIVVVGDGEGQVGVGMGKANEVPEAIRKATNKAKASLLKVAMVDGTVPHITRGEYGSGTVVLRPAAPGTGVIAGPAVRAIMDAVGYRNVLSKSLGSSNPYNVVRATFAALEQLESPEQFAVRTNQDLDKVLSNYNVGARVWRSA
ncbi:30S ribosomal protein S5 [Myxococcota bacterium]|nr:30S ribosomal protein S5 [Myxococcota bacterium]